MQASISYVSSMKKTKALQKAIKAAGGVNALAKSINITSQAVSQWREIPVKRCLDIEKATGIPREELRPDFFKAILK